MTEFRYSLAKYAGTSSRLTCPACGKPHCFTPYVDEEGNMLDPTCGRCDRESKCGYHLSPHEFFQQNPEARPRGDAWREPPAWLKKKQQGITVFQKPVPTGPVCVIPKEIVDKTISFTRPNNLIEYLSTVFDPLIIEGLVDEYKIGTTKSGACIFYQFDVKERCRGGKIIQYSKENGHRVKDTVYPVTWVHSELKRKGLISQDWELTQCLFGEHLLAKYPDRVVGLVESEKSALVCAASNPAMIWLATGGKRQLGAKLNILQGRKLVVYPDIDATEEWGEAFSKKNFPSANISNYLEQYCTDEEREMQVDIADLLIRQRLEDLANVSTVQTNGGTEQPPPSFQHDNPLIRDMARFFSPEVMPEVAALIEELDLQLVSVQQIQSQDDEDNN